MTDYTAYMMMALIGAALFGVAVLIAQWHAGRERKAQANAERMREEAAKRLVEGGFRYGDERDVIG